jgi:hypothetical protein
LAFGQRKVYEIPTMSDQTAGGFLLCPIVSEDLKDIIKQSLINGTITLSRAVSIDN